MELVVDPQRSVKETGGSVEPSHVPALGLAVAHGGSVVLHGWREESYWGECECPDDCPRDHENE